MSVDTNEWHKIGNTLCDYFGICRCQRKLKSIVDNLLSIKQKCISAYEEGTPRDFTGAEWLLIAMLNEMSSQKHKADTPIMHGVNCEYPIVNQDHELWVWLESIKDNPNLKDN